MALIEVDPRRYWSTVERSAEIGVGRPGGLARVALSDADREMRDQFVAWCREAGCEVGVDRVGNISPAAAERRTRCRPCWWEVTSTLR